MGRRQGRMGRGEARERRQDAAASAWLRQNKAGRTRKARPGERTAIGAASGRTTGNRHMQQFHDMRRDFEKKKDALARNINKPPPGRTARGW